VRPLPSDIERRRNLPDLQHPDPASVGPANQLQYCAEQRILAIRFNPKTGQRSLDALQWGLIPYWAKDPKVGYKTINARPETDQMKMWPIDSRVNSPKNDDADILTPIGA
jgi:putative SOS response-associated peptidase YedK